MMAPLFSPGNTPTDPHRLVVRLDVRIGSGRSTSYALDGNEFLIGGAAGCDLQLSGAHIPPVIGQITFQGEEVFVRRIAPAFPIQLNGEAMNGSASALLNPGDRIAVGQAEVIVNIHPAGHLHAQYIPPQPAQQAPFTPTSRASAEEFAAMHRERVELDSYRGALEEQSRELEADRVAWYRRRQELEVEHQRIQQMTAGVNSLTERESTVARKEAEVANQTRELASVRDELARIRQTLLDQHHEREAQLAQMNEVVRGASGSLQESQAQFEEEMQRRREQLREDEARANEIIEREVATRVSDVEAELRRRKIELEVHYDERLRELDAQAEARYHRFEQEIGALHSPETEGIPHREQIGIAIAELEAQRQAIAELREELTRDRSALEAEREWQEERRQESERLRAAREDDLLQRDEQIQREHQATLEDRQRQAADFKRLEQWQHTLNERQLVLEHRATEVDSRTEQLMRDALELEQQVQQVDAEHQRQTHEAERLAKLKLDLEQRAAHSADRTAQLESQQASLAVLRAKLDRREEELERDLAHLTLDRARADNAQRELDNKIRDAELLRLSLSQSQSSTDTMQRSVAEQTNLLEATLTELRQQKEMHAAEDERLKLKESELDRRSTDLAEQAAVLKAKLAQVGDLQARLEADRTTVQDRELGLSDAEQSRVNFQEQLRKRAEEVGARNKQLEEAGHTLADDKLALERMRAELIAEREKAEQALLQARTQLESRATELERSGQMIAKREAATTRKTIRLREAGRPVAAGRKQLFETRQNWETERARLEAYRIQSLADVEQLRQHAPELEERTSAAMERISNSREVLRGQLAELHSYASQTRETLDSVRTELRTEADQLREREATIERSRAEHRLAVAEFRQQLLDWQARVGDLKSTLTRSESRIESKQAALEAATKQADQTALNLVKRAEELQIEHDRVSERRTEVERHLSEMREWYRAKLRDLAVAPNAAVSHASTIAFPKPSELDPGDRQLGELLRSLELVDADSLAQLWNEASRQHRTLRQVLLANGAVTLYQLALIEAGNLDALMLGRFRVVDRVRMTPREAVYRVFDPLRAKEADRGHCVLRMLGDAEMIDATHPDEYRQRFAMMLELDQANLPRTWEVLEINGRPAVLQEAVQGVPGSEWPHEAGGPAVWVRILQHAAGALDAGHRLGLAHGRINSDAFLLTTRNGIKLIGLGEPPWLISGLAPNSEPTAEADLRALGQTAFAWSQLAAKKKGRGAKGLTESLLAVIRRLETDPQNTMGDTISGIAPYASAEELLKDLEKLAAKYPCSTELWNEFVKHANNTNDDEVLEVRRSA